MFKRGDKVTYLNDTGEAEFVEQINDSEARVLEHGMEYVVSIHELILKDRKGRPGYITDTDKINSKKADVGKPHKHSAKDDIRFNFPELIKDYLSRSRQHWSRRRQHFAEIDLHLEELVPYPNHVPQWQKIEIQMDFCQGIIEAAMDAGIHHLVFIHGKGEGRLREEIIKLIKTYSNIEFESAPFEFYGSGALDIYIRGLNSR